MTKKSAPLKATCDFSPASHLTYPWREWRMRRAAILVLFALLAAAITFAQTGTSSNPATAPQTQIPPGAPTAQPAGTGEDTQKNSAQPQPSTPGASQPASQNQQASPGSMPATQNANPAGAQNNTPSSAGQAPVNDQVTAGTEIRAALDTPLSTKTSKPGDRFTATITEPVRGSNGYTVIPAGTRVEGEVAETEEGKSLPALRDKANLSLRFRDIVLPPGQTLPLMATLISVNNTNGKSTKKIDEEGQIQSGARNRDVAKNVGIGAGAGTAAGPIFGGPLKGLAIGALAGGGYVLATKGKEVNLPAQTGMVIRLDQPVSAAGAAAAPPR